jgi:hypothetical protein
MTELHLEDLTRITAPFGLLDDATQRRLMEWPHGLDYYSTLGVWVEAFTPVYYREVVYRARPAPLVPDSVDWRNSLINRPRVEQGQ